MKIQAGSIVTIRYVKSDTIQQKRIVSTEDANNIRENKNKWMTMTGKEKDEFERANKTKFEFDEITEDSPLGIAIMGLEVGQIGIMELPVHQGGAHLVEIINIK